MHWSKSFKSNRCFYLFEFLKFAAVLFLAQISVGDKTDVGVLLCKNCGETIATNKEFKYYPSKSSLKHWNQTLAGTKAVPIQLFQNPHGSQFNVITFSNTKVKSHEDIFSEATWFEGFSWRISVCPRCGIHLGWKYQPKNYNHVTHSESDTFFGLILEKLLEESVSDAFLFVPNSYKM